MERRDHRALMSEIRNQLPGAVLATAIGLLAFGIGGHLPWGLNSIFFALLLGMIVGNVLHVPASFNSGIGFTSGKLLELSILFLAFSIDYRAITRIGVTGFAIVAVMVSALLFLSIYLSKWVKCPGSTGHLIGFGTTICGSSAIAALAPTTTTDKQDIGIAMAVVNLMGSMGMLALPAVLPSLGLSDAQMGLLIGASLHSVGNVAGAGFAMGDAIGNAAITVKLARVALLSPALIVFNYIINSHRSLNWKEHLRLPWYLWGFISITILSSLVHWPEWLLNNMETGGKLILTIAMAAIGLKVSFAMLFNSGRKGLLFGLLLFALQLAIVGGLLLAL